MMQGGLALNLHDQANHGHEAQGSFVTVVARRQGLQKPIDIAH